MESAYYSIKEQDENEKGNNKTCLDPGAKQQQRKEGQLKYTMAFPQHFDPLQQFGYLFKQRVPNDAEGGILYYFWPSLLKLKLWTFHSSDLILDVPFNGNESLVKIKLGSTLIARIKNGRTKAFEELFNHICDELTSKAATNAKKAGPTQCFDQGLDHQNIGFHREGKKSQYNLGMEVNACRSLMTGNKIHGEAKPLRFDSIKFEPRDTSSPENTLTIAADKEGDMSQPVAPLKEKSKKKGVVRNCLPIVTFGCIGRMRKKGKSSQQ